MATALLLIDIQNDYFADGKWPLVGINEASSNARSILEAFRKNPSLEIIHIRHEFETSDAPFFVKDSKGSEIHSSVKPLDDELVIVKHSPNSFIGTKLEETLKSKNITKLIIVGAMTHMCVQGTARNAGELGFNVTVPKDAVATLDLEHDGVKIKAADVAAAVFATLSFGYASVSSTDEILKSL